MPKTRKKPHIFETCWKEPATNPQKELDNQGKPKNEDGPLLKTSLDAQRLHKNRPALNSNRKGWQEENYGNGKAGPAPVRRQSVPQDP